MKLQMSFMLHCTCTAQRVLSLLSVSWIEYRRVNNFKYMNRLLIKEFEHKNIIISRKIGEIYAVIYVQKV